jgi:hypothetical protein
MTVVVSDSSSSSSGEKTRETRLFSKVMSFLNLVYYILAFDD